MAVSVFDLFKIGIGPSSSHTVGPMNACSLFLSQISRAKVFDRTDRVMVELYGSLALTGVGHGTDRAILLGLEGYLPVSIDPEIIEPRYKEIRESSRLVLNRSLEIEFEFAKHLVFFRRKSLPMHPNGLIFKAFSGGELLLEKTYYSVGGGFVVEEGSSENAPLIKRKKKVPFDFTSAKEMVQMAEDNGRSIARLMMENELTFGSKASIVKRLRNIWGVMNECIDRGCQKEGLLPGKLKVKRRAAKIFRDLSTNGEATLKDPLSILDWVNLYALAVNEENASGSRVVTAPTNGAAGIIPAVGRYYMKFCGGASEKGIFDYLLTAAAIGSLYAQNASISGAEVGCQGEVGVACSMAAGALCAVLGGTVRQVEEAAEIGMEHNLGLTCDPIGGLVQIPCIERNAMASVKAINAARIALRGTGSHYVSLDNVIKTMRQTGADMMTKYKETSRGGLAVNVIEC